VESLLCKRVVSAVVQETRDNPTEENIISALDNVCSSFPAGGANADCNSFVETYSDDLSQILVEAVDPSLACTPLGVC
jgi:hypothetical protein